jgi:hypothetical protein
VRAEEDRHALGRRLEPCVEVSGGRPDDLARAVLVDVEPEPAQVARDDVGDGALLARRAAERGQLEEELERGRLCGNAY